MVAQAHSKATLLETVAYLDAAIRAGYRGPAATTEAAKQLGLKRVTYYSRLLAAKEQGIHPIAEPPLGDLKAPVMPEPIYEYETEIPRPRIRVKAPSTPSDAPVYRVLGIGDIHAKPGRTTDPVKWAGRHAAASKPDRIIQIGDWLSLDSCSMHPARGSYSDHDRPSFSQDIEAGEESLEAFDKECPGEQIPRTTVHGNHEHRAWRRADADPKMADDFPLRVTQTFARYRWETKPFGQMFYYGGVGWVHVPLNAMGKPYGGKHSENTIGNDATHSVVWGHDHRYRTKTVAKIGPNNRITLCNLGTCMPNGEIEDYNVGTTGWTYGLVDLRLQAGLIVSAKFIDMQELADRYGD